MIDKINILMKVGMLSSEDRKQPLTHQCEYFKFESNIDLSEGVKVIPYGNSKEYSTEVYSRDLASFISWWNYFVQKDLNGFSGFGSVDFELVDFKLV